MTKQSKFVNQGTSFKVPPIHGFNLTTYQNIREFAGCFPLGVLTSQMQIEGEDLSIIAGMGVTPAGSEPFLRALIVHRSAVDKGKSIGIAITGDALAPDRRYSLDTGMYLGKIPEHSIPGLQQSGIMLKTIVDGLRAAGVLKQGSRIDPNGLRRMYIDGMIDHLVSASLDGTADAAIKSCDPNSLEWVPDLDFEIGLGIPPGEPTFGCMTVHADDLLPEPNLELLAENLISALREISAKIRVPPVPIGPGLPPDLEPDGPAYGTQSMGRVEPKIEGFTLLTHHKVRIKLVSPGVQLVPGCTISALLDTDPGGQYTSAVVNYHPPSKPRPGGSGFIRKGHIAFRSCGVTERVTSPGSPVVGGALLAERVPPDRQRFAFGNAVPEGYWDNPLQVASSHLF